MLLCILQVQRDEAAIQSCSTLRTSSYKPNPWGNSSEVKGGFKERDKIGQFPQGDSCTNPEQRSSETLKRALTVRALRDYQRREKGRRDGNFPGHLCLAAAIVF